MDTPSDDEYSEEQALIDITERGLSNEEQIEMREVIDKSFRRWGLGGVVGGVFTVIWAGLRNGLPWGLRCPTKAAEWLGSLAGCTFNALLMYVVGMELVFPSKKNATSTYSVLRDVWLFLWSTILCQSFIAYVVIHRKHIELVEPGPTNQIYGVHGHFAAQLLLKYGKLFDSSSSKVPRQVERALGTDRIDDVIDSINKVYRRLGVAPIGMSVFIVLLVFITLFLWKHASHSERRAFDEVDALVPLLLLGSFFTTHYFFCRKTDRILAAYNSDPAFISKNLAWVLWRTPVTHSYSLWLVRRNPEAQALIRSGADCWWEHFPATTPVFKCTSMCFLMLNMRLPVESGSWLPNDLRILVLTFLAEGNVQKIVDAKRRRIRAVMF
eukprot:TRINITY_DN818_c0_g1_i1.p1 TRINITY_DN818_c0_g1~~TRINITY_DN818_c0_g1_i1.p1  ORF type:complete len:382 (+),score=29.78 TRINITY_DN818_c0_g1_i1:61-1206(+)